jgi:hypothetical protein
MRQDLNPAVLAVEMELNRIKAELEYYKRKEYYNEQMTVAGPVKEIAGLDPGATVTLPLTASIKAAHDVYRGYHVIARTYPNNPVAGIGVSYFVDDRGLWNLRDQAYILSHMHEKFCMDLADHLRKTV